jgi:mRNA-degrading endonuclease toxin of MazEF toxin-antitoxin module
MLNSGDVVRLDLGLLSGREASFRHPAVVVTAQRILNAGPSVVHVVPLTSRIRRSVPRSGSTRTRRMGLIDPRQLSAST